MSCPYLANYSASLVKDFLIAGGSAALGATFGSLASYLFQVRMEAKRNRRRQLFDFVEFVYTLYEEALKCDAKTLSQFKTHIRLLDSKIEYYSETFKGLDKNTVFNIKDKINFIGDTKGGNIHKDDKGNKIYHTETHENECLSLLKEWTKSVEKIKV